jgi:hypothetical protein
LTYGVRLARQFHPRVLVLPQILDLEQHARVMLKTLLVPRTKIFIHQR